MPNISTNNHNIDNAPVQPNKIIPMVQDIFQENGYELGVCCEKLTQSVSEMSSKHKFIVNVTEVKLANKDQNVSDICVNNSFGTNWDNDKDGVVNCSVIDGEGGRLFMVSVFWINEQSK